MAKINPVLHNLPLPVFEELIGRQKEREQLYELLSPQSPHRVIALRGIGGIGKSSLALEIGHFYAKKGNIQPHDPGFNAVVWVSVGTSHLAPFGQAQVVREFRTLRDLLTAIALTFHRSDIVEKDLLTQREAVQELLINNRTLLIIDNLEESVDINVLDFIEAIPEPTKVLFTTRQMLIKAKDFPIEQLSDEDANDFVQIECEKIGLDLPASKVQKLARSASYVPLVIQFAVGQIYDGLSYEEVLTRMEEFNVEIAEKFLARVMHRLENTDAYTILLAASLFSQEVSSKTLGIAAGIDNSDKRESLLDRLVSLSLLQKRPQGFSMLPLIRRWLKGILKTRLELEDLFWQRLTDYYKAYTTPQKETELQTEVETIIDVVVWHLNQEKWEIASQLLQPLHLIPSAKQFLDFAEQMILVQKNPEGMHVAFATPEEMPKVCELEGGEFVEGVASSSEKMMGIYARNPKTFMALKTRTGEICGFASVWPVVSEFVDDLITRKRFYTEIRSEEVHLANHSETYPTDYYVDTVMVTDVKNITGAFHLIREVRNLFVNPIRIITVSVTPFGRQLVEKLGMRVVWQSDQPVGPDYHYCCVIDTTDPDLKRLAEKIISPRHRIIPSART